MFGMGTGGTLSLWPPEIVTTAPGAEEAREGGVARSCVDKISEEAAEKMLNAKGQIS